MSDRVSDRELNKEKMEQILRNMNMNDYVCFELTEVGRATEAELMERDRISLRIPEHNYRKQEEGYFRKMQIWEFCNLWGPAFYNGCPLYFMDNNLIFIGASNLDQFSPFNQPFVPFDKGI